MAVSAAAASVVGPADAEASPAADDPPANFESCKARTLVRSSLIWKISANEKQKTHTRRQTHAEGQTPPVMFHVTHDNVIQTNLTT